MTLEDWLSKEKMTQDAFGIVVGLSQGRVSQIVSRGTRDLATAKRIEDATAKAVRVSDLIPDHWREALDQIGDGA